MSTRAVILAAGRGSRMEGLTAGRPKCLVEVAGKPLLHWQLEALAAAGLRDVLVVRGYRGDMLRGGFQVADNPRWESGNMVRSLLCAAHWLEAAPCLVSYSDIAFHPDHARTLAAAPGGVCITYDTRWESLWRMRFSDPLADAESFRQEGGLLRDIGRQVTDPGEVQGQYMGLCRFTPQGWAGVRALLDGLPPERVDRLDMTALIGLLLAAGAEVRCVPVDGRWIEIDSGGDLRAFEEALDPGRGTRWEHDWRW